MTNIDDNIPFFSIITINYNSGINILSTISSVNKQVFRDFEYLIIDGGSNDISLDVINQHSKNIDFICSEKDNGIYDGINKGIANSKGRFIILLHAGDYLENKNSLKDINSYILNEPLNDFYLSDVLICSKINISIPIRYYSANIFKVSRLCFGIMPAHPAIIIKREVYDLIGTYSTEYQIASDFDFIIRLFRIKNVRFTYMNKVFLRMIDGGISDKLSNKIILQKELKLICEKHKISTNHFMLLVRFIIKFPSVIQKMHVIKSFLG